MFLAGDTRGSAPGFPLTGCWCLLSGVDVDVPNKIGQTPLMKALASTSADASALIAKTAGGQQGQHRMCLVLGFTPRLRSPQGAEGIVVRSGQPAA